MLESPDAQAAFLSWNRDSKNDSNLELLAACLLELKCATLGSAITWPSVADALDFAQNCESTNFRSQIELLDELDITATESWKQFRQSGPGREAPPFTGHTTCQSSVMRARHLAEMASSYMRRNLGFVTMSNTRDEQSRLLHSSNSKGNGEILDQ